MVSGGCVSQLVGMNFLDRHWFRRMGDEVMWNRIDLKMNGKANFLKNYGPAVLVSLISALVATKYGRSYSSDGLRDRSLSFRTAFEI